MDGTEFAMRMLEYAVEVESSFKSGFVSTFAYVLEHRCLIIKDFNSVIVIHKLN